MNVFGIIIAVSIVGGVGLLIGIFLSFFGNYFKVETDPKEEAVLEALPGNNCGGCGYAGCSGLAAAIAKGEAPVSGCPVGGEAVANVVAGIMGVDADGAAKQVAHVKCSGNCEMTFANYEYKGVKDCRMASFVPGSGPKSCSYGCTGFGNCVNSCQFDAIHIVDGIAVVDKDKCKACGKCIEACPKKLISLIPYDSSYVVACSSLDKGVDAMKKCEVPCIGCSLCAKNCPVEAITVENFNATIDQSKCTGCGTCIQKCPKKAIVEH